MSNSREYHLIEEDGYVKVRRGNETIAAGVWDRDKGQLTGIEFTSPEYQKNNRTRLAAVRLFQGFDSQPAQYQ